MLVYVRWPNGSHTLAQAPNRQELYQLLDEAGQSEFARFKLLPTRQAFAIDFRQERDGEDAVVEWASAHEYGSTYDLLQECAELSDSDLQDGKAFFGWD